MAEALRRGVYTTAGEPVLITPTLDQIARINGINKAGYFSGIGERPIFVAPELAGAPGLQGVVSPAFLEYSVRPLSDRIRQDLRLRFGENVPDRVAVRGTVCSLAGRVEIDDFLEGNPKAVFGSLEEILSVGTDRGGNSVKAESPFVRGDQILTDDALGYTQFHARKLRFLIDMAGLSTEEIFPLVLVFDPKYQKGLLVTPPSDQPGDAILNAYVLDYPVR